MIRRTRGGRTHSRVLIRTEHIAAALGISLYSVNRMIRQGRIIFTDDPIADTRSLLSFIDSYRAWKELDPL